MELIERSGGIYGFVHYLQNREFFRNSQRSSLLLSYLIGLVIFIESSITVLIAGAVGKPLCKHNKIPKEKLAFVCDSTAAPVCSLILLNGWGALLLGLITTQVSQNNVDLEPLSLLLESILYNFYAMSALVVTFLALWFSIDLGAMKDVRYRAPKQEHEDHKKASLLYMVVPLVAMVFFVFLFLYISGDGDILKGSGSSAIFYTMLATLTLIYIYYIATKNMTSKEYMSASIKGIKKLIPIVLVLFFAFAIGEVTQKLQSGLYLASLTDSILHPLFLAPLLFILSGIISFATGTSWGTFSIMIPIAIPMALGMDTSIPLAIGAVISGGIFGDHCSPISDTTIISSLATECDVIAHVKTQLPYALLSAFIALSLFLLSSFSQF